MGLMNRYNVIELIEFTQLPLGKAYRTHEFISMYCAKLLSILRKHQSEIKYIDM